MANIGLLIQCGVTFFYYVPFIYLFLYYVSNILKDVKHKKIYMVISLLTCLPMISYLNYMGFVDIGGLSFIILLLILAKKDKTRIRNNILMGLLIISLYFFRRWYAYYAVSFLVILFIFDVYSVIKKQKSIKALLKKYITIVLTMIIVVLITMALNVLLFKNDDNFIFDWNNFYLYKLLFVDYSQLYSAYSGPLSNDIVALGTRFGYAILLLTLVSLIIAIKNKKNTKEVLFLLMQSLLCFILFKRTQSHDLHHFLLYTANIMAIISFIFANSKNKTFKAIVATLVVLNLFFSLPICYNLGLVKSIKKVGIVNSLDLNIRVREDIDEIEIVNDRIKELSANGSRKIYFNASSDIINDSMICSYDKTYGRDFTSKNYMLAVAHVDSRDGVPMSIRDADIVIVTKPDQLHMNPKNQKMVAFINSIFLEEEHKTKFSNKYEYLETMNIGDIQLFVYNRKDKVTEEDFADFVNKANKILE